MKIAVLMIGLIAGSVAHAGECRLVTKGYVCRAYEFGPCEPLFKNTLDQAVVQSASAEDCVSQARAKKAQIRAIPERNGARTIFTKVKVSFKSDEEALSAELE